MADSASKTKVARSDFDNENGVCEFTLSLMGYSVGLINFGATVTSVRYPDNVEVVLGFASLKDYNGESNPFFWGTTGRYTNRITGGTFPIKAKDGSASESQELVQLSKNDFGTDFRNHVHGGYKSFDKRLWKVEQVLDDGVVFSLNSPDGEEGYPGNMEAKTTYRLVPGKKSNTVKLINIYEAVSDRPTIVNLSNHVYFNLGGHDAGREAMFKHTMKSPSAKTYTMRNKDFLCTGEIAEVKNSGHYNWIETADLLPADSINDTSGIVVNVVFDSKNKADDDMVAAVTHVPSGRIMNVYTNQPCMEVYTGNWLGMNGPLNGKQGSKYDNYGGFCLMAQNYPDGPNFWPEKFPTDPFLRPGETYRSVTAYEFGSL